jgi:Rieske Fe-S protein
MNENTPVLPRRTAVAGTVAVCGLAAGCARYGGPNTPAPPDAGDSGGGETGTTPAQAPSGEVLGAAADIPVGGGTVFKDQEIVVTQPVEGEFKGFSAICTHQGCVVNGVADGTINCDCHGSKFAVADGSATAGPASEPLPEQQVSVTADGQIVRGEAPAGETTEPPATEETTEAPPPGLASTSEIPVGGGKIFADEEVVITQPAAGEFRAFSAVCTHQGCMVTKITGGTINCECHGSKFAVADGAVTAGPASKPLPERTVRVSGDQISLT